MTHHTIATFAKKKKNSFTYAPPSLFSPGYRSQDECTGLSNGDKKEID